MSIKSDPLTGSNGETDIDRWMLQHNLEYDFNSSYDNGNYTYDDQDYDDIYDDPRGPGLFGISWLRMSYDDAALYAGIVLIAVVCCMACREPLIQCWRSKLEVARAKKLLRSVEDGLELASVEEPGFLEVLGSAVSSSKQIKALVELDGVTHTIPVHLGHIGAVSQLPFILSEACADSGAPELAGIDLVELQISKDAHVFYVDRKDNQVPVDHRTKASDLMGAKAFRVKIRAVAP